MAPVGSTDARLLILGSLPGEASLRAQRYYAHPQNQFWRLLGSAIGVELASVPYEDRLVLLAARGIALWDVVGEARRLGSLDGAIRAATPNRRQYYDERAGRYYYYDSASGRYYWENGDPRY